MAETPALHPQDELQRARDVLVALKTESTPGPWLIDEYNPAIWTGADSCLGGTVAYINTDQQTGDHRPKGDAELISVLHASLDGVIALLEAAIRAGASLGGAAEFSPLVTTATDLARLINNSEVVRERVAAAAAS